MSVQLNNDSYAVIAVKGQEELRAHGVKDTRWHSVDRAHALIGAGYIIMDIQADGKTDVAAHQMLLDRFGETSKYAAEHKLVRKAQENGKAPAEKTMEVSFAEQEVIGAPIRNLVKLATKIGQEVLKGKKPVDSSNLLAQQAMDALKVLGVSPEVVNQAFTNAYQPKSK